MAYTNLVNQSIIVASYTEHIQRIRDFVCKLNGGTYDYSTTGIGWTLVDEYHGFSSLYLGDVGFNNADLGKVSEDWFVIHSTGEDGTADMYIRIRWDGAVRIVTDQYAYWDASTHTGSDLYYDKAGGMDSTNVETLWIYGDLDTILMCTKTTLALNRYFWIWFGRLIPFEDHVTCITQGALTAGSDVEIITDIHGDANWEIGDKLLIRDADQLTCSYESITITNVNHSTPAITADLSKSYGSGARIQHRMDECASYAQGILPGMLFNPTTDGRTFNLASKSYHSVLLALGDPDTYSDRLVTSQYVFHSTTNIVGGTSREWFRAVDYWTLSNIFGGAYSGVILDENGDSWRIIYMYNAQCLAIREV